MCVLRIVLEYNKGKRGGYRVDDEGKGTCVFSSIYQQCNNKGYILLQ